MGTVGRVRLGERSHTVTEPTDRCMRYGNFEDVFVVGSDACMCFWPRQYKRKGGRTIGEEDSYYMFVVLDLDSLGLLTWKLSSCWIQCTWIILYKLEWLRFYILCFFNISRDLHVPFLHKH
jgi:hypothetical protein